MKLLRETIRRLIIEYYSEEEKAEFKKWNKPEEAKVAVDEITGMFKLKDWWETGPWGHEVPIYELEHEPEPNCVVRIRVKMSYSSIYLDEIETTPDCEGKGYAREVIDMLKGVAKKHMVKIMLKAKAFHTHKGEGRMSSEQLEDWYKSQGFVKDGWAMEWKPS